MTTSSANHTDGHPPQATDDFLNALLDRSLRVAPERLARSLTASPQLPLLTEKQIDIIWNEHLDQRTWQRHNENQRAQLTNVLLLIAGALITFLPQNQSPNKWLIPISLMAIGVLGFTAVIKYWERFMQHVQLERAYRAVLDQYFAPQSSIDGLPEYDAPYLFIRTRESAKHRHLQSWQPLLKDRQLMQHVLWEILFVMIAGLGLLLLRSPA